MGAAGRCRATRVGDIRRLEQALIELSEDYRERGLVLRLRVELAWAIGDNQASCAPWSSESLARRSWSASA
jgi:hypothetical protein